MTFDEPGEVEYQHKRFRSVDDMSVPEFVRKTAQSDWTYLQKVMFNGDNIKTDSIKSLEKFQLKRMPTDDFITRMDLINTHADLFKTKNQGKMSKQEMEQLRILIVGDQKLWGSRKPNEHITCSRQFRGLKKKMQPIFQTLLHNDIEKKFKSKIQRNSIAEGIEVDEEDNIQVASFEKLMKGRKDMYAKIASEEHQVMHDVLRDAGKRRFNKAREFLKIHEHSQASGENTNPNKTQVGAFSSHINIEEESPTRSKKNDEREPTSTVSRDKKGDPQEMQRI